MRVPGAAPDEVIPSHISNAAFRFGHSLFGSAAFEVVHFAFAFYGFQTYNVLVNPNNPLVQIVLTTMVESGDYFVFVLGLDGGVTTFRSEIGQADLSGLEIPLPRSGGPATTEAQYRKAVAAFEQNPEPPGELLSWVCRDRIDYLDLTRDRLEMTPS